MGWNSFDGFGVYLTEDAARANLEQMAQKLEPFGYEYFVIDGGWYGEYRLRPGTRYAAEKHAADVHLDDHGYNLPSHVYFPHGFAPLIERCHTLGLKFGVHLMRGIPKKAVALNVPIEGTPYHARDIADTDPAHLCTWCPYNDGVNMDRPGAQAWYDGLIRHLAEQGVDYIKYDDIVPYPREVAAVAEAVRKAPRPLVLSLSPGGKVDPNALATFQQANLLRVTSDIWDSQTDLDRCFDAWRRWAGRSRPGFWIDMDMIPLGELLVMSPRSETDGQDAGSVALAGRGTHRWCQLSLAQQQTLVTLRALSASPLMVGGDLRTMDGASLRLVTEPQVVACDQNAVMGRLIYSAGAWEAWQTGEAGRDGHGWIGLFNREPRARTFVLAPKELGLAGPRQVTDIWNGGEALAAADQGGAEVQVPANGVLFLRY